MLGGVCLLSLRGVVFVVGAAVVFKLLNCVLTGKFSAISFSLTITTGFKAFSLLFARA